MSSDVEPAVIDGAALSRRYQTGGELVHALEVVDVTVIAGRLTVVAGPSGSGKSTLLRLVACLDRPDDGRLTVAELDVVRAGRRARRRLRRERLGIVHAAPAANLLPDLDAAGNLAHACQLRGRRALPAADLDAVGLAGRGAARMSDLSSGEQLRLGLAIALAGPPAVVIADEPTASLDRTTGAAIAGLLASLAADGVTLLVASHDPAIIERADQVIQLDHGRRVG